MQGEQIKLALSAVEFWGEPLDRFWEIAEKLGVEWVELWYQANIPGLGAIAAVQAELDKRGLKVCCVSAPAMPASAKDSEELERARRVILESIKAAQELGASVVSSFFGPNPGLSQLATLEFYRRAYLASNLSSLERVKEEMKDRFGKLPDETALLFHYLACRLIASELPVERVSVRKGKVILIFKREYAPGWYRLEQFLAPFGLPVKIELGPPAEISIDTLTSDKFAMLKFIRKFFQELESSLKEETVYSNDLGEGEFI